MGARASGWCRSTSRAASSRRSSQCCRCCCGTRPPAETGSAEEGRGARRRSREPPRLAAHKLGKIEPAVAGFERALALVPTSLPALAGLADLQVERQAWPEVARLYRTLLANHEAALPEKELLDVYVRLGRATTELGDREAALAYYEKASAQSGQNRTALEGIASLHADEGDYAALVLDKRALLALGRRRAARCACSRRSAESTSTSCITCRRGSRPFSRCWRSSPGGARRCTSCSSSSLARASGARQPSPGAARRPGSGARCAREVPLHRGADPARRAQRCRGGGRAPQPLARGRARRYQGLRRDRAHADRGRIVEGAGAQLPARR